MLEHGAFWCTLEVAIFMSVSFNKKLVRRLFRTVFTGSVTSFPLSLSFLRVSCFFWFF